MNVQMNVEA